MAKAKERSVFWVVSTHVLTTGFVMPLLAGVAATAIVASQPGLDPWMQGGLLLGLQALGYLGGVYYSLSYIRKVAIIARPLACITPSIVTFAILATIGLGINASQRHDPLYVAVLVAFYTAITLVFAFATRQGFRQMAAVPTGFPVQLVQRPTPVQLLDPPS